MAWSLGQTSLLSHWVFSRVNWGVAGTSQGITRPRLTTSRYHQSALRVPLRGIGGFWGEALRAPLGSAWEARVDPARVRRGARLCGGGCLVQEDHTAGVLGIGSGAVGD